MPESSPASQQFRALKTLTMLACVGVVAALVAVAMVFATPMQATAEAAAPRAGSLQAGASQAGTAQNGPAQSGTVQAGTAQDAAAAQPTAPRVTATVRRAALGVKTVTQPTTFVAGKALTTRVRLTDAGAHEMRLQYRSGKAWKTAARATSSKGRATLTTAGMPKAGSRTFRVHVPGAQGPRRNSAAWTATRADFAVTASPAKRSVMMGARTTVTGTLTGAPKGTRVELQYKRDGGWTTSKSPKATATAKKTKRAGFTLSMPAKVGQSWVRVKATAKGKRAAASPATDAFGLNPCKPGRAPSQQYTYTQNNPNGHTVGAGKYWQPDDTNGSGIAGPLTNAICSAKPGATITLSNFVVYPRNTSVNAVFNALEYKALVDRARVKIALETRRSGLRADVVPSLSTWADVTACAGSCTDFTAGRTSIKHSKFVTISGTQWKGAAGPFVWYSSANFSNTQLRQYWQSAVTVTNAGRLYADTTRAYDQMAICSSGRAACASGSGLVRSGVRDAFGTPDGIVLPTADAQRHVTAQADFSPTTTEGADPWRDVLHGMQCKRGGKVQLLTYEWSKDRADTVRPELNRLAAEGCSVKVIVGEENLHAGSNQVGGVLLAPGQRPDAPEWRGDFAVKYASRMHVKALQATGVTFNDKPGRFVYYGGSQNLTDNANAANNENMVLLTGAATGTDALSQVRGAALAQFDRIWRTETWYN